MWHGGEVAACLSHDGAIIRETTKESERESGEWRGRKGGGGLLLKD